MIGIIRPALTQRLALWAALCALASVVFFWEFWANITFILSLSYARTYGVFPWGVLALCALMLWAKRGQISTKMQTAKLNPSFILVGLALFALAVVLPSSEKYIILQMLLAFLGIFTALFAEAAIIPTILVAIYGSAMIFPSIVSEIGERQYSLATAVPVVTVLRLFGFPITNQGQIIHIPNSSGDDTYALVNSACAGTESMAVFLAIFVLMMMDYRLSPRKAVYMFLFGVITVYLQNFLRVVVLLLAGYYSGQGAMLTAHEWVVYIIFPVWFALFAYVYLRQSRPPPGAREQD